MWISGVDNGSADRYLLRMANVKIRTPRGDSPVYCEMCLDSKASLPTFVKSDTDIRSRRMNLCLNHQDDAEAADYLTIKFPENNSLVVSFTRRGSGLVEQVVVRGHDGLTARGLIAEVEDVEDAEVHEVFTW